MRSEEDGAHSFSRTVRRSRGSAVVRPAHAPPGGGRSGAHGGAPDARSAPRTAGFHGRPGDNSGSRGPDGRSRRATLNLRLRVVHRSTEFSTYRLSRSTESVESLYFVENTRIHRGCRGAPTARRSRRERSYPQHPDPPTDDPPGCPQMGTSYPQPVRRTRLQAVVPLARVARPGCPAPAPSVGRGSCWGSVDMDVLMSVVGV